MNQKGFTLIELILVITLLGILAATALPKFYDVTASAHASSHKAIAGSINSALGLYRSNAVINNVDNQLMDMSPLVADGETCTTNKPCFSMLLNPGITDGKWIKQDSVTYIYNGTTIYNYLAPSLIMGEFICISGCE